jgi:hypothetical protein
MKFKPGWVRVVHLIVSAVGLALLISLGNTVLLFYAGLLFPAVTLRVISALWWWSALVLLAATLVVMAWRVRGGWRVGLKAWRGYAWTAVILSSMVVLFYAIERWRGHRIWQQVSGDLGLVAGEIDLVALEPPPVAESANFAASDSWRRLIQREGESHAEAFRRLEGMHRYKHRGYWEAQESADLDQCAVLVRRLVGVQSVLGSDTPAAELLQVLAELGEEMDGVEEASLRAYARFDIKYDRAVFDRGTWEQLGVLRGVGEAVRLRALARLAERQLEPAYADVGFLLRLADLASQEPLFHEVRRSLLLGALQPIWEGLARESWSDKQLVDLETRLSRIDLIAEYPAALRVAMRSQVDLVEKLFPARTSGIRFALPSEDEFTGWLILGSARVLHPVGWSLQNQAGLLRLEAEYRGETVDIEARRFFPDNAERLRVEWVRRPPSLDPFFVVFVMPRATETGLYLVMEYAHAQTALDLAIVASACERYRRASGRLPATLGSLSPAWVAKLPVDVMDGEAMRYRRDDGDRLTLYSIGWNQDDDGGRAVGKRSAHDGSIDKAEGDWVWRYPAVP